MCTDMGHQQFRICTHGYKYESEHGGENCDFPGQIIIFCMPGWFFFLYARTFFFFWYCPPKYSLATLPCIRIMH